MYPRIRARDTKYSIINANRIGAFLVDMASTQRVASQIVQINSQLIVLQDRLKTAETTIASQEEDIRKLNQSSGRRGRRAHSDDENDGLAPKKFFEPPIMTKGCTYREWAEEFTEHLEEKSGDVVKLLKEAAASKTTI